MSGAARLGDRAKGAADSHGCPGCPHPTLGPAISGSSDVFIDGLPAVRVDDVGIHTACCGPNTWSAARGAPTVFINGRPVMRIGDETRHCGGVGQVIEGSQTVFIDEATSAARSMESRAGAPQGAAMPEPAIDLDAPRSEIAAKASTSTEDNAEEARKEMPTVARWRVVYDDGRAARGFQSHFEHSTTGRTRLDPDGAGGHRVPGCVTEEAYALTIIGTREQRARLVDADEQPIASASVVARRAFGPPRTLESDADGVVLLDGLLDDEPFTLELTELSPTSQRARVVDGEGRPVARAHVAIRRSGGRTVALESDADGMVLAAELICGEAFSVEIRHSVP